MTDHNYSELLAEFSPGSKELLADRQLLRRKESKFVLPTNQLEDVLRPLIEEYRVLLADGRALASYETLYFDTPDLRCFHDHRRGRRPRYKIRLRSYPDRSLTYLEIKTKRSEYVTQKHRELRTYGTKELVLSDYEFIRAHSDVPPEELLPQLWTNFERVTLLGTQTEERITIDTNLRLVAEDTTESLHGVAILEVKQALFCFSTPVMLALRRAGQRQVSASKYCTATVLLRQGLRMNRLRPAIRFIEGVRS